MTPSPDPARPASYGEEMREAIARIIEPEAFGIVGSGVADPRGWAIPLTNSARWKADRILAALRSHNEGAAEMRDPFIPTPEMIAAAWGVLRDRWPGQPHILGPGPGFREAIEAAFAEMPPHNEEAAAMQPPPGLLMSMALRYDHGLGMAGYYDWQESIFGEPGTGTGAHARRLESTLTTMRQLWEEVVGQGFYSPDKEADYAAMADRIRSASARKIQDTGGEDAP